MEKKKKNNEFKWYHWFGIILLFFMIFIGISEEGEETTEEKIDRLNRESCSSQSNTFYKCSWSFWEDRCVCKQR